MSEILILDQFKKQLISFLDELISQFPETPELVLLRILCKDQIPISEIMNNIIVQLPTIRPYIKDRDEKFFLEYNILSNNNNGKDNVNTLKKLWRSGRLDNEDKQVIWKWIDTIVMMCDRYSNFLSEKNKK
jgi:hypothetical protein